MRILESITHGITSALSNFSDLFEVFFRMPFQGRPDDDEETSILKTVAMFPVRMLMGLVGLVGMIFLFPFRALTVFSEQRRLDFLMGLPAVFVMLAVLLVGLRMVLAGQSLNDNYRKQAEKALSTGDFERAKTYYGRVINQRGQPTDDDRFRWAFALSKTGEVKRATAVIDSLAPDNRAGYALAHRLRAINLAANVMRNRDPEVLKKIKHHLDNCGDEESADINKAWSLYYLAVKQKENAVDYMEKAAKTDPNFYMMVADIYRTIGNENGRQRTLNTAEAVFRGRLKDDPLVHADRIMLANVLSQKKQYKEAEGILLTGVDLQNDAVIRRACADFYAMRYDLSVREEKPFAEQFGFLKRSLDFDLNYIPVYQRLIAKYQNDPDSENSKNVKALLEESIASGNSTALSHFALSNILWIEDKKEESQWHMEQAYRIDNRLLVVANNLAWVLAHQEKDPDLPRAMQLIEEVVAKAPRDPRYRDTYGTLLMLNKQYREATIELEKSLERIQTKAPVHRKLEKLYRLQGNDRIADEHKRKAEQLEGKAKK